MTQEQVNKVLREIQASVPENLRKAVYHEEEATPTMKMVMEEALTSDKVRPELKEKIQNLYDAGEFSRTKTIENQKVAKQIDNYVNREIKKAIKAGRLPRKLYLNDEKTNTKED